MLERIENMKNRAKSALLFAGSSAAAGIAFGYLGHKMRESRKDQGDLMLDVKNTLAVCALHDLLTDYIEQKVQGAPVDIGLYAASRADFKERIFEIFSRHDSGLIEEFCQDHNIQSGRNSSEMN